ncbi:MULTISPECIES: hypothetical protein [unclassified Nonomuraea]|uniref:hypothetical protein n=1 Tax=unclassified Nonomuraea TaxID=2593643 RepID=UPI0034083A15
MLRLRSALRYYFPAALAAYQTLGLTSTAVLVLLAKASTPQAAARLTVIQITAALKGYRDKSAKAAAIQAELRAEHLGQSDLVASAYAATVAATVAVLQTLDTQIATLEGQVEAHFGRHPDAEILLSQPGIGAILGARVLAEFGDARGRYASAPGSKTVASPTATEFPSVRLLSCGEFDVRSTGQRDKMSTHFPPGSVMGRRR